MEEALSLPTRLDFNAFKSDIEEMILQRGFSNDEVVADLARKG